MSIEQRRGIHMYVGMSMQRILETMYMYYYSGLEVQRLIDSVQHSLPSSVMATASLLAAVPTPLLTLTCGEGVCQSDTIYSD